MANPVFDQDLAPNVTKVLPVFSHFLLTSTLYFSNLMYVIERMALPTKLKTKPKEVTTMKTFTIANTTWTMSEHLMTRMEERGIDEFDIKCALKYGKSFASVEDETALLTIFEMDPNDYEGQMTNYSTKATHLILVHKKNAFGVGREILTAYYGDGNNSKVRYNMGK